MTGGRTTAPEVDATVSATCLADDPDDVGGKRLTIRLWEALAAHPLRTTAVLGAVVALVNVWWISEFRLQGGFDGDETSYLASAMRFRRILTSEGVVAFFAAVISNHRNGPLTSALSALTLRWSNPLVTAMVVQPLFHVVAALAVAALVRRLVGNRPALLAGLVALALPGGILAARSYQLVPAATAFLCMAVLALVASNRGQNTGWMAAYGASVGAMLISRTMTVAFLPGLFVATVIVLKWNWRNSSRVLLAGALTLMIAAPWWVHEWNSSIVPYLFRYGYGRGSNELGPSSPLVRALVRLGLIMVDIRPLLQVPAIAVCVGGAVVLLRRIRSGRELQNMLDAHRSLIAVWSVIGVSWCALLSSSNMGTWFQVPLEILAVAALVATGASLRPSIQRPLWMIVTVVSVANLLLIGSWQVGSTVRMDGGSTLSLPLFGGNETSHAIDFEAGDSRFAPTSTAAQRRQAMQDWALSENATAAAVQSVTPRRSRVMQTFIGDVRLFQSTTLELAEQLTGQGMSPWEAPSARSTIGDGEVSLEPFSSDLPRVLVAVRTKLRIEQEGYSPEPVLAEAENLGWILSRRIPLPDGGTVDILTHPSSLPNAGGQT